MELAVPYALLIIQFNFAFILFYSNTHAFAAKVIERYAFYFVEDILNCFRLV
jgi:hypothetical protein